MLLKPSPSDSSQINTACDHRQEKGAAQKPPVTSPEQDSTDNQLLQVDGTIQHKKSAPQAAFVQILLPNALLPVPHWSVGLKCLSARSSKICLGKIMIQGEILAPGKASGH